MTRLLRLLALAGAALLVLPIAGMAWDSRDVEAAESYRNKERERAARFRADAERGRIAMAREQDDSRREGTGRDRRARRHAARQRDEDGRERRRQKRAEAWERQLEDWAERAEAWSRDLGGELGHALEEALRDVLDEWDRR